MKGKILRVVKIVGLIIGAVLVVAGLWYLVSYMRIMSRTPMEIPFEKKEHYALANKNSNETTQKIYDYLCSEFGTHMLSAQQESTWMGTPDYEMKYILEKTGKLPAIRGLDYINDDFDNVNERALAWWQEGGLVSICWHTGLIGHTYDDSKAEKPDFDRLFTPGTEEYELLMKDFDDAATHLLELQEAGVTVLWRPFHEFDGQWFWWGKDGADSFIKLWCLMYDKFTNEYGLNNLIWVLGYSHLCRDGWYVGDDYCDIIGSDTYDDSTNIKNWKKVIRYTDSEKPAALHECGNVPSVAEFEKDGCTWSWFLIWHTSWLTENDVNNLNNVYNSEFVITRDELPDFRVE